MGYTQKTTDTINNEVNEQVNNEVNEQVNNEVNEQVNNEINEQVNNEVNQNEMDEDIEISPEDLDTTLKCLEKLKKIQYREELNEKQKLKIEKINRKEKIKISLQQFFENIKNCEPKQIKNHLKILLKDKTICKMIASNEKYIRILDNNNIYFSSIYCSKHTNPLWSNSYGFRWACYLYDNEWIHKFLQNNETEVSYNNYGLSYLLAYNTHNSLLELLIQHPKFTFGEITINMIELASKFHKNILKTLLEHTSDSVIKEYEQLCHKKLFQSSTELLITFIEDGRLNIFKAFKNLNIGKYQTVTALLNYQYVTIINKTDKELNEIKLDGQYPYYFDNSDRTLTIYEKYEQKFTNVEEFLKLY